MQGDRAQVVPVDEHAAGVRIVEARHERGERRLAAAAGSDDRDPLARRDVQVEPVEDRIVVAVGESHVLEDDLAAEVGQLDRVRARRRSRGCRSSSWKIRSTPARACCPTVSTAASCRAGAANCPT